MANQKTWFSPREAAEALDLSVRKLNDLRRAGLFRVSRRGEVRDISPPGSARATYQYHIERCQKRLETPPELRESTPKKPRLVGKQLAMMPSVKPYKISNE